MPLTVEEYSEKSLVLRGDYEQFGEIVRNTVNGRYNTRLRGGPGWLVSKERLKEVEELVHRYHGVMKMDGKMDEPDHPPRDRPIREYDTSHVRDAHREDRETRDTRDRDRDRNRDYEDRDTRETRDTRDRDTRETRDNREERYRDFSRRLEERHATRTEEPRREDKREETTYPERTSSSRSDPERKPRRRSSGRRRRSSGGADMEKITSELQNLNKKLLELTLRVEHLERNEDRDYSSASEYSDYSDDERRRRVDRVGVRTH